jgi:hypothetical protein
MTGVDMPVTAERFPGLLVDGRHVRRDPGVEDKQTGRCSRITSCACASWVASAATGVKTSPSSSRTARSSCSSRAMPTTVWKGSDIGHSEVVVGFGPDQDQPPEENPSPQPKSGQ